MNSTRVIPEEIRDFHAIRDILHFLRDEHGFSHITTARVRLPDGENKKDLRWALPVLSPGEGEEGLGSSLLSSGLRKSVTLFSNSANALHSSNYSSSNSRWKMIGGNIKIAFVIYSRLLHSTKIISARTPCFKEGICKYA